MREKERHGKVTYWWALHRNGIVGYFYGPHWGPRLFRTRAEARKFERGCSTDPKSKALFTAKRVRVVRP